MPRLLTQFGMGTSLRRGDYTEAARRALRAALWSNSINASEIMGVARSAMRLDVQIGVQRPDLVDVTALAAVFPYGSPRVTVIKGGLDVPRPGGEGAPTVMANASIAVHIDAEADR